MSYSVKKKCIALVGSPNSGKTTLYNWLTGSRFKTVNYPGATVEYSLGHLAPHLKFEVMAMDTPGTYSLQPKSADEMVTVKALYENPDVGTVDGVIVVVDGTQMSRHLLLAEQVRETGFPLILVITMADLLRKQGITVDLEYLRQKFQAPVVQFDGLLAGGLIDIVAAMEKVPVGVKPRAPLAWDFKMHDQKLVECEKMAHEALAHKTASVEEKLSKIHQTTERIDSILLHPWFGLLMFFGIMGALFSSIFWVAAPFMDAVDKSFSFLKEHVIAINDQALWTDFIGNGIVGSFGAVMVFVPQIFILFFCIGILESSGYLARAATLIDRPFSRLGMSGRSFVPILSGFACAVPAMIATRNISSTRDRWITTFVIPLMTCSARLPVYALLIAFLYHGESPWRAGFALASLYLGSLVVGGIAAGIVNKLIPEKDRAFFMMELPLYRKPKLRVLVRQSLTRTLSYVKRAGPAIFTFAVLIWVGTNFPRQTGNESAQQKLEKSYAGQVGHIIEPVVYPMGVDWRVGVGLISAFAAREVFVSSMAVVFDITDTNEETSQQSLLVQMKEATDRFGRKVFTTASIVSLLIFFMIALQCMSTFVVSLREMHSMKFALTQLAGFNLVAYVLAVGVYQSLNALGYG